MMLRRYLVLETAGTLAALAAGFVTAIFSPVLVVVYITSLAENLGFYGTALLMERGRMTSAMKNLFKEFGPAEIFDTLLIRPVCMYSGMVFFGIAGILLGKIVADVFFYALALLSRKYFERIFRYVNEKARPASLL